MVFGTVWGSYGKLTCHQRSNVDLFGSSSENAAALFDYSCSSRPAGGNIEMANAPHLAPILPPVAAAPAVHAAATSRIASASMHTAQQSGFRMSLNKKLGLNF